MQMGSPTRSATMLTADGAVVQVDTVPGDEDPAPSTYPVPPRDAVRDVVQRYLGERRRAGQFTRFVSPTNEDNVWRAAGYTGPEHLRIPDGRVLDRSIDDLIAGTLSMSSSAPHLFGDLLPAFEHDLRAALLAALPTGHFNVALPDTELKIWRVRDTPRR